MIQQRMTSSIVQMVETEVGLWATSDLQKHPSLPEQITRVKEFLDVKRNVVGGTLMGPLPVVKSRLPDTSTVSADVIPSAVSSVTCEEPMASPTQPMPVLLRFQHTIISFTLDGQIPLDARGALWNHKMSIDNAD